MTKPTITYGETTKTESADVFVIETIWPDSDKQPDAFRWGTYMASAYDDVDHRSPNSDSYGTFDAKNEDVSKIETRVRHGLSGTAPAFSCPFAALAYADRLRERGRLTAACGREDWRSKREGPLQVRVVRDTMLRTVRVVEDAS